MLIAKHESELQKLGGLPLQQQQQLATSSDQGEQASGQRQEHATGVSGATGAAASGAGASAMTAAEWQQQATVAQACYGTHPPTRLLSLFYPTDISSDMLLDIYRRSAEPIAANTYRAAAQQAFWLMRDEEERLAEERRLRAVLELQGRDPDPQAPPGALPAAALSVGRFARARAAVERTLTASAAPPPPPIMNAFNADLPPLDAFASGEEFVSYLAQLRDTISGHVVFLSELLDHKDARLHGIKTCCSFFFVFYSSGCVSPFVFLSLSSQPCLLLIRPCIHFSLFCFLMCVSV